LLIWLILINKSSKKEGYTHIIEFHTIGSDLGLQLTEMFNAKFSVIFDSPVDEQFYEMFNTKSLFWNKIKNLHF